MKNNKLTIVVIALTLILAGVAIFTAMRLFQLRDQQVAPTAPESEPAAQNVQDAIACEAVTFTLASAIGTPSPFVTTAPSPTPTATPIAAGSGGGLTSTPTPTATATATASPTPTSTSIAQATSTPSTSTSSALPDAGFSLPTFIIVAAGLLLVLTALVLAL